jgi:tripartite-type tricarboxylate transporter receptor subunit TctC
MRLGLTLPTALGLLALPLLGTAAHAQSDFYAGKTVQVIIGAKGGSLTVAAEIVARHLGKHIPGKPNAVLVRQPGGAHLGATGNVYSALAADGLTILAANPNVAVAQLAGLSQVRFDVRKYEWIGSSGPDGAMFAIRASLPFKTIQEVKASGQELVVGTTGPGSNAHDMPLLLKEFAGIKLKLVSGYAANSDILLAVERKEVDGWAALSTTIKNGIDRGAVRAVVRARASVPGFNELPIDESLTNDPIGKSLMAIRGIPLAIGRAFAVRPGTPPERVKALREAFKKAIEDPALQADAKKAKIDMVHVSSDEVSKAFAEMFDQKPEVMAAMKKYLLPR